jgi:cysteinyl-tRNA synthetase
VPRSRTARAVHSRELSGLTLYNTLTRRKEAFEPIDANSVRMYACGPTVYDHVHIGNGRMAIVFDVLFRLLRHIYGPEHVIYARNITDVDDKINARAAQSGVSVGELTAATARQYQEDVAALGCLPPSVEPRATEHIADMKAMIETLVLNGHAYVAEDHVLFSVPTMQDYGRLSNRSLDEMEAGARVEVAPYKRDAMDFVLWKPSKPGEPAWPSPAGIAALGRPGWHIECSAMAERWLWQEAKAKLSAAGQAKPHMFDIHGGGIDLVFPHHENEVAQSRCAHATPAMANVWMHNGFLQVEGEKMSKSLGNFVTIRELLETRHFGDQPWHGRVIRWAMLGSHYRQPIDWTVDRLLRARSTLMDLAGILNEVPVDAPPHPDAIAALLDDLNTPSAISIIHGIAKSAARNRDGAAQLKATLQLLGVYDNEKAEDFAVGYGAKGVDSARVEALIGARNAARNAKNFRDADRIRDELSAMGIQLKDAKGALTGEIETTWELKR